MALPLIAQIQVVYENQPPRGPTGGGSGRSPKETSAEATAKKQRASYIRQTLGLQVGLSAILKQSQIFTGVVGTVFQLIGALVDVILAPFLPVVVPAIKLIAKMIPIVADQSKFIVDKIAGVLMWLSKIFELLPGDFGEVFEHALGAVLLGAFWLKVTRLFTPAFHLIQSIAVNLSKIITWTASFFVKIGNQLFTRIGRYIPEIINNFVAKSASLFKPITDLLPSLVKPAGTILEKTGLKTLLTGFSKLADLSGLSKLGKIGGFLGKGGRAIPGLAELITIAEGGTHTIRAALKGQWEDAAKHLGITTTALGLQLALDFGKAAGLLTGGVGTAAAVGGAIAVGAGQTYLHSQVGGGKVELSITDNTETQGHIFNLEQNNRIQTINLYEVP